MLSGLVRLGVELGYFDADQLQPRAVRIPVTLARDPANPWAQEDTDTSASRIERHQLPSPERIERLARALPAPYDTLVRLASYCGARWGELTALRHGDVDVVQRTISIDRAFLEAPGGVLHVRLPKSRRKRKTLYPPAIAEEMERVHLAACTRGAQGGADLLFPSRMGRPLRRSNFHRYFKPARTAAGWDGWTFHTLRHAAAVWMLEDQHWALHDVADLLGHRDSSVTQRIYVQAREDVAQRLAALAS